MNQNYDNWKPGDNLKGFNIDNPTLLGKILHDLYETLTIKDYLSDLKEKTNIDKNLINKCKSSSETMAPIHLRNLSKYLCEKEFNKNEHYQGRINDFISTVIIYMTCCDKRKIPQKDFEDIQKITDINKFIERVLSIAQNYN